MPELTGAARNSGAHTPRQRWTCSLCHATGPGGAYTLQLHIDRHHPHPPTTRRAHP